MAACVVRGRGRLPDRACFKWWTCIHFQLALTPTCSLTFWLLEEEWTPWRAWNKCWQVARGYTSKSAKYNTEYNPGLSELYSAEVVAGTKFAEKSREQGYNRRVAAVFSQVVAAQRDAKNEKAKKALYAARKCWLD
jgi:hypothetical protein